MLKTIMAAAAVSTLALTSAMAQATNPPAGSAPAATQVPAATPAPTTSPTASAPAKAPAVTASTGAAKFVTKQTSDQWLASKYKGTDVIGTNDEKIGDVSDMLFDKNHKILAYIVGVGGFLGIGAKDVAIDPASFQIVPASGTGTGTTTGTGTGTASNDNFKLRLSMTKDELKNAPAFEQYSAPRPVSSQAPATRPMGAPAPMTAPAPAPKQ